jgi:histidinol dehydrogenase
MKTVVKFQDFNLNRLRNKAYGDDPRLKEIVVSIIKNVREQGDRALFELTLRLDVVDLEGAGLQVTSGEIEEAYGKVDGIFLQALRQARENIYQYHATQKRSSWFEAKAEGSIFGQLIHPLQRAGIYVPGGTAAYPSSVMMNALPAVVAGVEQIVMVTPPLKDGTILPEVLIAAKECGVTEIYKSAEHRRSRPCLRYGNHPTGG